MAAQYYMTWTCHHVINYKIIVIFRNMCTEDIATGNSIITASSSSIKVSHVVSAPPPRGTKFGDELPHNLQHAQPLWESSPLLQWESWISTVSTYIISLAILFLYSFYYYALGMGSIGFTFPGHLRLWHVTGMSQQLSTMLPFSLVSYTCCQATPLYLDTYHRLQRNN